jgi:hypothetical protein
VCFFFGKVGVVYPSLIAHLLLASYIPVSLFLSVRWFIYIYIYYIYIIIMSIFLLLRDQLHDFMFSMVVMFTPNSWTSI